MTQSIPSARAGIAHPPAVAGRAARRWLITAFRVSRRWSVRALRGLGALLTAPSREMDPMGWPTLAAWMQHRPISREDYRAIEQTAPRNVDGPVSRPR